MNRLKLNSDNIRNFGCGELFRKRIKKLCRVVPEFCYNPILIKNNGRWEYDNKHFWLWGDEEDSTHIAITYLKLQDSFLGFEYLDLDESIDEIEINCESFGIRQASYKRVCKSAGVPEDYVSPKEQRKEQRRRELRRLRHEFEALRSELSNLKDEPNICYRCNSCGAIEAHKFKLCPNCGGSEMLKETI